MTALSLFMGLGERIPAAIEAEFGQHTNCILATRLAIEVAGYFRIEAHPMAVQVVLMNAQFARHVDAGDCDVRKWAKIDGSHSVGIGCGFHPGQPREGRWDGHLIAVSNEGCFGDFSIQQAERAEKGILTGPALVAPVEVGATGWSAIHPEHGTVIQYRRTKNLEYLWAPDWREETRRRKLTGPLIRQVRSALGAGWKSPGITNLQNY